MPALGHFILHSAFLPSVTAGPYTLVTEHAGLPFPVAPETTHVHVAAPRYVMPIDQIVSSFPPANAEGAFGDRLPQVVLKRRTLPWERNPAGGAAVNPTTPWLALVVVAEGEAELSGATPVADCVTAGTPLHLPGDKDVEQGVYLAVTETVVKKIFPTIADLALLTHVREVDIADTELVGSDDDGWMAVVLANRLPVFDTAAGKPVRYMACLVNVEGQLPALPLPQPALDRFVWGLAQDWSSLATLQSSGHVDAMTMGQLGQAGTSTFVSSAGASAVALPRGAGNAPPSAHAPRARAIGGVAAGAAAKPAALKQIDGGKTMAQPAQAEQWRVATAQVAKAAADPDAQRLVRSTMKVGFHLPITQYALEKVLRFPVLAHWSFTSSEGATFETLMQNLDVGLLGTLPPAPPPEAPPRPDTLPEVVTTGHVGLAQRARRGDALRAWYRGPCVPFPTSRDGKSSAQPLPLAHAADQLRRVVPDGREDLALAAAFEIGRLLALSQLSIVSALLRFRAEQFGAGRVREILGRVAPFQLPKLVTNAGPKAIDLGRFVAVQVIDVLAKNRERMLGPQRPIADPGRELKVEGDIDRVIAEGLGLDYDAVVKRSSDIGIVAALSRTVAPVAGTVGGGKFDEAQRAALADALTAEVNRTLLVAAPLDKVITPPVRRGRRGSAAATPALDALDDLLARSAPGADDDADDADDADDGDPR